MGVVVICYRNRALYIKYQWFPLNQSDGYICCINIYIYYISVPVIQGGTGRSVGSEEAN